MKILVSFVALMAYGTFATAQSQEAQQLLLNYEKLKALEEILDNMYKGYKILDRGYTAIRNIAEGNFSLHQLFLDGLYAVNPSVRNYKRIPYIISYQQQLAKEYKTAYNRFRNDPSFTASELRYVSGVYEYLLRASLRNIEELTMIVTASKLRMSDDERMQAIDRLYYEMQNKVSFLRDFNNTAQLLALHRAKDRTEIETTRKLYEVEP